MFSEKAENASRTAKCDKNYQFIPTCNKKEHHTPPSNSSINLNVLLLRKTFATTSRKTEGHHSEKKTVGELNIKS